MGKGAPSPPDPYKTADAQAQANFLNAQQNFGFQNVNEYNPYGQKTYEQSGWYDVIDPKTGKVSKTPQYSSTVTLSPGEQAILDKNTAMRSNIGDIGVQQSGRLLDHLGQPINTQGLQGWNAGPQAAQLATGFADVGGPQRQIGSGGAIRQDQGATDRAAIEQAMMERYQRQADPRNQAQNVELANRGLSPGSQGYGTVQQAQGDEFAEATRAAYLGSGEESRRAQEAYNQAQAQRFTQGAAQGTFANQAQQQAYQQAKERGAFGNQALSEMFTMGGAAADRENALRQSQWTERLSERNQPINEIMALLGGAGVNTPSFQPYQGSTMQAPNIGQYIYDNYNAKSQQASNNMSGMFGIGAEIAGALPWAAMLSDRRAKQDIVPFGADWAGVPLYWFRYRSDPTVLQVGVMADEVRKIHPDAVHVVDGYDHVDYDLLRRRHSG